MSQTPERPSLEGKVLSAEHQQEAAKINSVGSEMAEATTLAVKQIIVAHRKGMNELHERTMQMWKEILEAYPELVPYQNELSIDANTGMIVWSKDKLEKALNPKEGDPCPGCGKVHKKGEDHDYDITQEVAEMDFSEDVGDAVGAGIGAMLNTEEGDGEPFIPQTPPEEAPPPEVQFETPPPPDLDSMRGRTEEFLRGIGHTLGMGESPPESFEQVYQDTPVEEQVFTPAAEEIVAETPAPTFEEVYKAEEIPAESFHAAEPVQEAPAYEAPTETPDTAYESSGGSFDTGSSSDSGSSYDSGGSDSGSSDSGSSGDSGGGSDGGSGGGD